VYHRATLLVASTLPAQPVHLFVLEYTRVTQETQYL